MSYNITILFVDCKVCELQKKKRKMDFGIKKKIKFDVNEDINNKLR